MALGSASKNAGYILKKTQLTPWFDVIIDGTKTSKAKPDPEVFLLAARGLNVLPHECVVFEDAEAGVESALNAGMYCIGIGNKEVLGKANFVVPGLYDMSLGKLNF